MVLGSGTEGVGSQCLMQTVSVLQNEKSEDGWW